MTRHDDRPFAGARTGGLDGHVAREILLSFWKVHILHHASEHPLVGQWMLHELRRHGYQVSPGTLYPVLKRMTARGWLTCKVDPRGGLRARREYGLTPRGRQILDAVRAYVAELQGEVGAKTTRVRRPHARTHAAARTGGRRSRQT